MIRFSDNARNVSTCHESKLLMNPTFLHVLKDQTLVLNLLQLISLRIVNAHLFSILKMLCKRKIEKKNRNFSVAIAMGILFKRSIHFTLGTTGT